MKPSLNLKSLIVAGYALVVVVMILGLFLVYRNLVRFSEKKVQTEDYTELIIVGNTISKLYEIENAQSMISVRMAEEYFQKYDSIMPIIERNIDTLITLSNSNERSITLDSIKLLLTEKTQNLREIEILLDSIEKAPKIERQVTSSFVPKSLNHRITDYLKSNKINVPVEKTDTTVILGNKKGFFARVQDVFNAKTDSTVLVEKQSIISDERFELIVDTLVNIVRHSERLNLDKQRKFQDMLKDRHNSMTQTNDMLTARIDFLLKTIEREEYNKSIQLLEKKNTLLMNSQRIIFVVSLLSMIIAGAFGVVSLININKNRRYRRELEDSNRKISDLLVSRQRLMLSISHDIKAPMSSIMGYTELLDGNIPDEKKHVYLHNIYKSGQHILQLVTTLLNYHKLESGTWLMNEANYNPHELITETAASFNPLASQKNLALTVENNIPLSITAFGDAYMVRQIVSNLLSNAIRYTSQGLVRLRADVDNSEDRQLLSIAVEDTGHGIDENEREIVFMEFRQLQSEQTAKYQEGSGLGLAIVSRLVKELGGTIHLDSKKGKGSTFRVKLPMKEGTKIEEKTAIEQPDNNEQGLKNTKVLYIDDDPIQLTMVTEMLRPKCMSVHTEANLTNALTVLQRQQFDIIFVDMQMPQMNGLQLTRLMRKSDFERADTIPIVLLTATAGLSKQELKEAGITALMPKPFSSHELQKTVLKYVENKNTADNSSIGTTKTNKTNIGVAALYDFVKDDKRASLEILNSFINEMTDDIKLLENAIDSNNAESCARVAHKIMPIFEMIGCKSITKTLCKLEKKKPVTTDEERETLSQINQCLNDARRLKYEIEENE